jgi:hypothetical protein
LETYFHRLTSFGKIQDAAKIAKEILTMYHKLCEEDPSTYFKSVVSAVAMYDTVLTSAGHKGEGTRILVDVRRAQYQKDPQMTNARELAEHLATYAQRLDDTARWQDACNAAVELVDILRKHPVAPSSAEARHRTQQLHACSIHVAKAREFRQALDIAELAMQSAQDVEENEQTSEWIRRWRPKTKHTYDDIKQVVRIKKPTLRIREAQKLRLTYRDTILVKEPAHRNYLWNLVALGLGIAAGLGAVYVARRSGSDL